MMSQYLLFKSETFLNSVQKSATLKTPNLVPVVLFETMLGTRNVLWISKASSLSVNFAEFLKIAKKMTETALLAQISQFELKI